MLFKHFQRMTATAGLLAGLLASTAAYAQTNLVVGYQQIVGPFVAARPWIVLKRMLSSF